MMQLSKRTVLIAGAVAILAIGAAACSRNDDVDSRSATQGLPNMKVELIAKTWQLDGAASTPELKDAKATLEFDSNGTVSGRGPCNNFHGDVEFEGDNELEISNVSSTLMGCEKHLMDLEAAFHEALDGDHDVEFTDGHSTLTLKGDGQAKLIFRGHRRDA